MAWRPMSRDTETEPLVPWVMKLSNSAPPTPVYELYWLFPMVITGGISLVDFSLLLRSRGSNGHLEVSILGSGAEPLPETPLLNRLVTPIPRRTFTTVFALGVRVYRTLPSQSPSVVTDSAACLNGAGISLVNIERLMVACRCWLLWKASSTRRKYLSVGRVTLMGS